MKPGDSGVNRQANKLAFGADRDSIHATLIFKLRPLHETQLFHAFSNLKNKGSSKISICTLFFKKFIKAPFNGIKLK